MKPVTIVSLSLGISSLLHFATAPERFQNASDGMGVAYILLGILQAVLAIGCFRSKNKIPWAKVVIGFSLTLLILFLINQLLTGQVSLFIKEPYSLSTILRKYFEIMAALGSVLLVREQRQKKS